MAGKRKRRTREHVIADLSVNHVERMVLQTGYTIDRLVHDYGLDLMLVTYNESGYVEPGQVFLQVKATDSPRISADGARISCRVERTDLERWLQERMPVILVLYDALSDVAYWTHIQADVEVPAIASPGSTDSDADDIRADGKPPRRRRGSTIRSVA